MNGSGQSWPPARPSLRRLLPSRRPRALPSTFVMPALGSLSDAVGGASRAPARVRARWRRLAASARRGPLRSLAWASSSVGCPACLRAMGRLRAWRNHGRRRLARWAELGRREEARAASWPRRAHRAAREHARTRLREPGRQERHPGAERGDRGDRHGRAARALRARRQPGGTDGGPPLRRRPEPTSTMTAAVGAAGQRAGFVTRLGAVVADAIILWVALRGTVVVALLAEHALRRFAPPFSLGRVLLVCAPVIASLYNIVFWWLRGQTPGKWLLGPPRRRAGRRKDQPRSGGPPVRRLPALGAPLLSRVPLDPGTRSVGDFTTGSPEPRSSTRGGPRASCPARMSDRWSPAGTRRSEPPGDAVTPPRKLHLRQWSSDVDFRASDCA